MISYYNQSTEEIFLHLKTSPETGLSSEEVRKRLGEYGYNKLESKSRKSFLQKFFAQFKSFMIIILLIAAAISGVVGVMEGEGLLDTFVILGILILNAFVGAYQEIKAETSLEALKNLAAPETKALRDGVTKVIPTSGLVPGDVVILETGGVVPADLRLTEAINLKIQESALTGESVSVEKHADVLPGEDIALGDRINMAFSGSMVTYGRGRGVVVFTGMKTEVGKIAHMLQETVDTETPMSRRLGQLGKILGTAALIICAVIFIVGVLYGNSVLRMFMTAVSLAVAAIPEGLPAVSTVVLAIGVQRMVKRNAIIRTLPSVETLGSATVICSDKTGTLTQNKMTVVEAYVNHKKDIVNRDAPSTTLNPEEHRLLSIAVLCADAQASTGTDGKPDFSGDPTETALLDFGILYGVYKSEIEKERPRIAEIPFDSERKRMTTVNRMSDNIIRINLKGGADEVMSVCDSILIEGKIRPITPDDTGLIHLANETMADSALRVLAIAYRDLTELPREISVAEIEKDLVFVGLIGMIDPARPEVTYAVARCNDAGIRPVMITGDHKNTAMAIAREIGIFREGDLAVTGAELEKISEEEFRTTVTSYSVYARVAPEHKVRIVKALQLHDEVVAMTGDGVNDAPALKQADIGAAMGIAGTDVAKGAADMVLTDDNFATIVSAVEEGRRIYDNILKAIQFLLSTNVGEIFLLLITSVFNLGIPLLPVHILWVNLVTDSLPALALSVDPAEKDIMSRKPRNSKRGFMTRGMVWRVMYQGIMIGIISLIAYIIGLRDGGEILGQTMAFTTLIFAQLMHVRNLHSNTRSSLTTSPLKNKPLVLAILVSAGMALLVLFITPVRIAFSLTEMDGIHWLYVVSLSIVPIVVVEIFKLLKINSTRDEKSG
ncbi:MAG: calcium-translocating P-type ATPase, PMCA-type [Bacteroidales bacterium]|nr:calcium-translocating P-type ATPase, PMCA-type [Bacteroidales bacterium]